jgi:hypothetical protein
VAAILTSFFNREDLRTLRRELRRLGEKPNYDQYISASFATEWAAAQNEREDWERGSASIQARSIPNSNAASATVNTPTSLAGGGSADASTPAGWWYDFGLSPRPRVRGKAPS